MELIATREIVLQLKAVKAERGLSWQDIKILLKNNGDYLAQSTLQRVFADGSENDSFRYESTLAPLVRALLWQSGGDDTADAAVADDRIAGLQAVILLKDAELEKLRDINEHLESRVEFLLEQISLKDRRMDEKDALIQKLMEKVLT